MWTLFIAPVPMRFQAYLGVGNGNKEFAIERLVSHLAVKTFLRPILPRAAGIDMRFYWGSAATNRSLAAMS